MDTGRTEIIRAICDAMVPSLEPSDEAADEVVVAYYTDGAASRGIDDVVITAIPSLDATTRDAIDGLVEYLRDRGFLDAGSEARIPMLRAAGDHDLTHRLGLRQLKAMVFASFVTVTDPDGVNRTWPAIGYPGHFPAPPTPGERPRSPAPVAITVSDVDLTVDVAVIGAGAGGAVIAARAAQAGRTVVVLDRGEYRTDAVRSQHSLDDIGLYLKGGPIWSESGQLSLLAGSAVGGGTLINSMVCLRPPAEVRRCWTADGLTDLDSPVFDAYLDRVWDRLDVNTEGSHFNNNTRAMVAGLAALGYGHERLPRNFTVDESSNFCAFCLDRCRHQTGRRNSALVTYLDDAVLAGAQIIAGAVVDRIAVVGNRGHDVVGTVRTPSGSRSLRVRAGDVVVAAGGIESPGILLRSGIGGPAVGRNLRVHPAWIVTGVYDEPIDAWHGPIQAAASFDLTDAVDGWGFLVETLTLNIGMWAGQMGLADARVARDRLRELPRFATWHAVSHDHGAGQVYLDADGRTAIRWSLDDEVDLKVAIRAHQELASLHRAAGASQIFTFAWPDPRWVEGEDFPAFLRRFEQLEPSDFTAYSAHQMGACRLGADPSTSVGNGRGELHDAQGVWIGDASALPTAPGVNPMITIMALAERTADALLAQPTPRTARRT